MKEYQIFDKSSNNHSHQSSVAENQLTDNSLITHLCQLPEKWQLVPVFDKKPYLSNWTKETFTREFINSQITDKHATGYGLKLGICSDYSLAIDQDGLSALAKLKSLEADLGILPVTVEWSSGINGKKQLLYTIPEQYRDKFKVFTRKCIKTSDTEQLEFRFNGCQSVLPPSRHPQTKKYKWINSPLTYSVAYLPDQWCDYICSLFTGKSEVSHFSNSPNSYSTNNFSNLSSNLFSDSLDFLLYLALTKSDRNLIDNGTSQGSRNELGYKLAVNLIATASRLDFLNIHYEGDPYDLFIDFCSKCSPSILERER